MSAGTSKLPAKATWLKSKVHERSIIDKPVLLQEFTRISSLPFLKKYEPHNGTSTLFGCPLSWGAHALAHVAGFGSNWVVFVCGAARVINKVAVKLLAVTSIVP